MSDARTRYRYQKMWYFIAAFLLLFIVAVSLWPRPPQIFFTIALSDKILHFLAYFILMGWYLQLAYRTAVRLVFAASFCGLGLALEILQGLGGVRFFDWWDALANSVGVFAALFLGFTPFQYLLLRLEKWWGKSR